MIEVLHDMPEGVLGFEAVGEVHSSDYETVLEPALASAAGQPGGLRLVYLLGDRFDGYSAGAMWEDTKLGLGHGRKWERVALVSDHDWVGHMVKAFGWMMPGSVRHFPTTALADAAAWAAAD